MIYLHVGMHKTGTTFMQQNVFPRFKGVTYIRRENLDQFLLLDPERTYLASNERLAGRLWATQSEVDATIRRLAEMFPGVRILVSFRPHADFILSSYKQFLHQGGTLTFDEYFDFERDSGFMTRDQFIYRKRIESVAKHVGKMPFVFFLREIRQDLQGLLRDLEQLLGATAPSAGALTMKVYNRGVGYHPAKLLRWLNTYNRSEFNRQSRFRLDNRLTTALKIDPRRVCQYWLAFLPDRDFLSQAQRERIGAFYGEDWEYVESCARSRRSLFPGPA